MNDAVVFGDGLLGGKVLVARLARKPVKLGQVLVICQNEKELFSIMEKTQNKSQIM